MFDQFYQQTGIYQHLEHRCAMSDFAYSYIAEVFFKPEPDV